jgi:capsule polysaccharide export protein KpsE/RkpR
MRDFQEAHRIVDLETQAKAVVTAMAELNARRIGKQLELDYARTFSSRDEPSLKQLRSELSVMSDRLEKLEVADPPHDATADDRAAARKGGKSVFPPALEVPKLRAEYEKLLRDRRVAEAMLVFALERYENAKASEAREFSTFVILDPPALPTRKARPSRTAIVAFALGLGLGLALVFEGWRAGALPVARRRRAGPVAAAVHHVQGA